MIDVYSKYDSMHKNRMFYALRCINNHITECANYHAFRGTNMGTQRGQQGLSKLVVGAHRGTSKDA